VVTGSVCISGNIQCFRRSSIIFRNFQVSPLPVSHTYLQVLISLFQRGAWLAGSYVHVIYAFLYGLHSPRSNSRSPGLGHNAYRILKPTKIQCLHWHGASVWLGIDFRCCIPSAIVCVLPSFLPGGIYKRSVFQCNTMVFTRCDCCSIHLLLPSPGGQWGGIMEKRMGIFFECPCP
jgi:hypothetical protein